MNKNATKNRERERTLAVGKERGEIHGGEGEGKR